MEPWDGPASIAFTDGTVVGATLDRNGLRPSRYVVTKDDVIVLASEVGVLEFPPERVLEKGRLQPGRMLLIDTAQGRILADDEIKKKIAAEHPYREWLDKNLIALDDLVDQDKPVYEEHGTVLQRQQAFGYAYEDLRVVLEPMAKNGVEPDRGHGNGHASGGAVGQTPTPLQLFQAAVRPGHQPAHRLHPGGNRDLGRDDPGGGAKPVGPFPRELSLRLSSSPRS
jgi:hypothetical protein